MKVRTGSLAARRGVPALASCLLGVVFGVLLFPAPAHAASRVGAANEFGKAEADITYATELKLQGRGFQAIKNGHGGIYVFFGTVNGNWRPSQGGVTGKNLMYVPDSESKNNQGYQKFIAFEGSDTQSAAHGVIRANGTWSTTIKVPGAKFQTVDRNGKVATVDCTKVRCGIITIGAHGVKNARNESFTPIRFTNVYQNQPSNQATTSPGASTPTETAAPQTDGKQSGSGDSGEATATGPAKAVIDPATAVVGRVLTFSGTGFQPGEQITASFDDGRAAVGPLQVGPSGEVAGVLQLPADIRPGTHKLRLIGAASGASADLNFPVRADDTVVAAEPTDSSTGLPDWAAWAFLAATVFLLLLVSLLTARRFKSMRKHSDKHGDRHSDTAAVSPGAASPSSAVEATAANGPSGPGEQSPEKREPAHVR